METAVLQKLGLNENEVKIYITLLQKGPCIASDIAMLIKLHRTHAYDLLESLVKKGLVSFMIKEGKKYFQAAEPQELDVLLEKKKNEIKEEEKSLSSLISELTKITSTERKKLIASVFQGKPAFQSQLNDIIKTLKKGEEYLVLGFTQKSNETLKYFLPGFTKRRVEKGIKRKAILDIEVKGSEASRQQLQQVRYLPKDYHVPMGIIVYKNKVVLVVIEEDYVSIVIENEKTANNFRKYFELIWNKTHKSHTHLIKTASLKPLKCLSPV